MRNRRALVIALAAAVAWPAAPALADWRKDYDRGLKAVESGDWAEAESAFRAALAEDGAASARKRFQGVVFKVYVPHHYAGLAAYRQGNCERALQYWSNAGNAGVVASQSALGAVQDRGIADCNQKLAQGSKPATPPPAVAGTTAATPPPRTTPATTPPATTPPATRTPVASTPVEPVAKPPVANVPPASTRPPPATPVATPTPVASSVPAPAALSGAVDAYLAGRYADVTRLEPASLSEGRAKAHGFLLRAASRHTLALLAEGDAQQLEQARRDVRAARAANANLAPDETLFSPRFRAFWRATR